MPQEQTIAAVPLSAEDRPRIEAVLAEIRPLIEADGGALELVSAAGNTVVVRLGGQCMGCIQTGETLGWIRRLLMQALGKALRVLPARPE